MTSRVAQARAVDEFLGTSRRGEKGPDLNEAHHKLRAEQAKSERLHEHLDEEAKSARAAKGALEELQKEVRELCLPAAQIGQCRILR
jgi:hypothetical protein